MFKPGQLVKIDKQKFLEVYLNSNLKSDPEDLKKWLDVLLDNTKQIKVIPNETILSDYTSINILTKSGDSIVLNLKTESLILIDETYFVNLHAHIVQ